MQPSKSREELLFLAAADLSETDPEEVKQAWFQSLVSDPQPILTDNETVV